jgi:hypothetical protein
MRKLRIVKFPNPPDTLSFEGAMALKQQLVRFWAVRGRKPIIKLIPMRTKHTTLYSVRSDINSNW